MRVFGDKGLSALQRRPLIEELLVGADPTPMLVQLDALFACGMAEIEAVATGKRAARRRRAIRSRSSGCRWPSAAVDATPAAAEQSLYDKLFGDDTGPVPRRSRQPRLAVRRRGRDLGRDAGAGDGAAAVRRRARRESRCPTPPSRRCARRCCTSTSASRARTTTRCCGSRRDAAPEAIAAAYAALGKQFRLERFADVDLGPDYARLEEIHTMLRAAFETLSSRELRAGLRRRARAPACVRRRRRSTPICWRRTPSRSSRPATPTAPAICSSAPSPPRPIRPTITRCSRWAVFQNEGANAAAAPAAWRHLQRRLRHRRRPRRARTSTPAASPPPPATTSAPSII